MIVWIYNIFTTDQMWCTCVSKYGICDINTIVNIKLSFTIADMSHIPHVHTIVNESFIFTIVLMLHIPYLLKHLYHI